MHVRGDGRWGESATFGGAARPPRAQLQLVSVLAADAHVRGFSHGGQGLPHPGQDLPDLRGGAPQFRRRLCRHNPCLPTTATRSSCNTHCLRLSIADQGGRPSSTSHCTLSQQASIAHVTKRGLYTSEFAAQYESPQTSNSPAPVTICARQLQLSRCGSLRFYGVSTKIPRP